MAKHTDAINSVLSNGPITAKALADKLGITLGVATGNLRALVKEGKATTSPSGEKGHGQSVSYTLVA